MLNENTDRGYLSKTTLIFGGIALGLTVIASVVSVLFAG